MNVKKPVHYVSKRSVQAFAYSTEARERSASNR